MLINKYKKIGCVFVCLLMLIVGLITITIKNKSSELYAVYSSPDKKFRIQVYKYLGGQAFPGQSGDSSGYVILIDRNNKIIRQEKISMVQLVDKPVWSADSVKQKLIFEWKLPRDEESSFHKIFNDSLEKKNIKKGQSEVTLRKRD